MDIQVPYNWERICYFASNENENEIKEMMNEFESKNKVKMNQKTLENVKSIISTISISQEEVEETIAMYFKKYSYIIDPHTAVGVCGSKLLNKKSVCIATASPLKFEETIQKILGIKMDKLYFKNVR